MTSTTAFIVRSGHLRPPVAATFAHHQLTDAQAAFASGTGVGKIVIDTKPHGTGRA